MVYIKTMEYYTAIKKNTAPAAKSLQSCPTLCYPIDSSPPGSPIPGILQARTLEWVDMKVKSLSSVWLLATPWTVAYQATLSMGFSRPEYWSGLPFPSPKQNEILPYTAMWMDLENIILSKISQTEEDKYHMMSLICRI